MPNAKYTPNATEWKMFQQIERVILKVGGVIFGGYPRDKIKHDHFAKLFYTTPAVDVTKYSDLTYLPEYSGRTKLPTDIDVFCTTDKVDILKKELAAIQLRVVNERSGRGAYWFSDGLKHTEMIVIPDINCAIASTIPFLAHLIVKLDVITAEKNMSPPFGKLDFQCNSILLHGNGCYSLSPDVAPFTMCPLDKIEKLQKIISDIVIDRAVLYKKPVQSYRIEKMLLKGWTVQGERMEACQKTPGDVCMLCLSEFSGPVINTRNVCMNKHIKLTCCTSYFHPQCMLKLLEQNTEYCPNCFSDLTIGTIDKQLLILPDPPVRRRLNVITDDDSDDDPAIDPDINQ